MLFTSLRRVAVPRALPVFLCLFLALGATASAQSLDIPFERSVNGAASAWQFTDVTVESGLNYAHGYTVFAPGQTRRAIAGGVAAGDFDNDGWVDLYLVRGDAAANILLRNMGDGTFEDVAPAAGVALQGYAGCGPFFADLNGDGWLDLFIGGIEDTYPSFFLNRGDGTFEDATVESGLYSERESFSAAAGDYDRDGDLDLFVTHWREDIACGRLWQNQGDATFVCVDDQVGVGDTSGDVKEFSFTPNFADINSDGWPDVLLASDFGRSQVFVNNGDGTFDNVTSPVISDENGMGAAIGDYDNDGDLDWFVSSIWDDELPPPSQGWGITGNRLYRNLGDGSFEDATTEAGVRIGDWGWGASFADFNNDGHLDLYHVNGWPLETDDFLRDAARMFVSNGDGTFAERGAELGTDHLGQGRGIVCFDYDRDGDLDIFIANANQRHVMYRNDGGSDANYLAIKLRGKAPNREGVGARIHVTAAGKTQMRELRAGSNFVSQNPVEAHFGLADATRVETVTITWPDGAVTELADVAVNQLLSVDYPQAQVYLDIKPGTCPNPLNIKPYTNDGDGEDTKGAGRGNEPKGVITVAVLGSADADVNDIDASSLYLEGVAPLRYRHKDVSGPPAEGGECACPHPEGDGYMDLSMKFRRADLVAAMGDVEGESSVVLKLTGMFADGTPFEASDCVRIVGAKGERDEDDMDGPFIMTPPARAPVKIYSATPNPFNPVTRIRYSLLEEGRVRLAVFNVKGERIATLVDAVMPPGDHAVTWDAAGVSSGLYFYRVTVGEFTETRKMILLK